MRIILEQVDDEFYGDLILTSDEIELISMGEMVEGITLCGRKRYYLGVRQQGVWENKNEDETWWDEVID